MINIYRHVCIDCRFFVDERPHDEIITEINEMAKAKGLKLVADNPTDTVNGYITIVGKYVEVHFYNYDEFPNHEHSSNIKSEAVSSTLMTQISDKWVVGYKP